MPRWIDVDRVTFKYGLGAEFIDVLKTIQKLELHSTAAVNVQGRRGVAPRRRCGHPARPGRPSATRCTAAPAPARGCRGLGKDGEPREVYVYHIVDNAWSMREFGHQAVVWQTAVMPAVAIELMATGVWSGIGVVGPGGHAGQAVPRPARRVRQRVGVGGLHRPQTRVVAHAHANVRRELTGSVNGFEMGTVGGMAG